VAAEGEEIEEEAAAKEMLEAPAEMLEVGIEAIL
jgi:hypothetical protein